MRIEETGPETLRRLPMLQEEAMNPEQLEIASRFNSTAFNKGSGPIRALLRSPKAAVNFIAMGDYLRSGTCLTPALLELLVLAHSRIWTDRYEWVLHARRASELGVPEQKIRSLREGRMPDQLTDEERIVISMTIELEVQRALSDSTYAAALAVFGEQGVADITFLIAQYCTLSMLLALSGESEDPACLPECPAPFAEYPEARNGA